MDIYLYRLTTGTTNKTNYPVKSFVTASKKKVVGNLVVPSDVLSPVIDFDFTALSINVTDYNYAYIVKFGRLYFIRDYTFITNDIVRIAFRVDVLATYYNAWKNLYAIVARNEFDFDVTLNDELMTYEQIKDVDFVTPTMTTGVTLKTLKQGLDAGTYPNVVLSVVCGKTLRQSVDSYVSDGYWVNSSYRDWFHWYDSVITHSGVANGYIGGFTKTLYYSLTKQQAEKFMKGVYNDSSKNQYVKSIMLYPCELDDFFIPVEFEDLTPVNSNYIYLGNTYYDMGSGFMDYHRHSGQILMIADFTFTITEDYRNLNPNAKYYIWLPYYDYVEINIEDVLNKRLLVFITCNFETGEDVIYLADYQNKKILFNHSIQFHTTLSLTTTNELEWRNNKNAINSTSAIQSIASVLGVVGGVTNIGVGNIQSGSMALGGGVIGLANTIVNRENRLNQNYRQTNIAFSSSSFGALGDVSVHIKIVKNQPLLYGDSTYAHIYGLPLYQSKQISTLEGYTKLDSIDMSESMYSGNSSVSEMTTSLCIITDSEKEELESILLDGFYMPLSTP